MINKLKTILFVFLFFTALCQICQSGEIFSIKKEGAKINLEFDNKWYFKKIMIPARSLSLWGDNLTHSIILLEFEEEKHILSLGQDSCFLIYSNPTVAINRISISSLKTITDIVKEGFPQFDAVEEKTKQIEDNILLITHQQKDFIIKNNCFSCHSLIPTALAINVATYKKYKIDETAVKGLISEMTSLICKDGSFYFPQEPSYGQNSTTLSGAYILALLADYAPSAFLATGSKIKSFLKGITPNTVPIRADFIFAPLFIENATAILHEIIFQKSMYLKDSANNDSCNSRAMELLKSIKKNGLSLNQKILLLSGIPYSYQIDPKERKKTIEELQNFLKPTYNKKIDKKEQIISFYILNRIAPNISIPKVPTKPIKNNSEIIWNCLEEVLYNKPKYLNGSYDE